MTLQPWIFSMQYLKSAIICSLDTPILSEQTVKIIGFIVIAFYTCSMIFFWLWMISTFPGYEDFNIYSQWYDVTFIKLYTATYALWFALNLVSTSVTVIAIVKIFRTVKLLEKSNENVDLSKRTMTLHSTLLIL